MYIYKCTIINVGLLFECVVFTFVKDINVVFLIVNNCIIIVINILYSIAYNANTHARTIRIRICTLVWFEYQTYVILLFVN